MGFTGNYTEYFGVTTDVDAVVYLMLVNELIHGLFPEAVTIGEDVRYIYLLPDSRALPLFSSVFIETYVVQLGEWSSSGECS